METPKNSRPARLISEPRAVKTRILQVTWQVSQTALAKRVLSRSGSHEAVAGASEARAGLQDWISRALQSRAKSLEHENRIYLRRKLQSD